MAGILDNKERVLDSIITSVGKAQLVSGQFKPAFYSFSDGNVVYSATDKFVSGTYNREKTIATKFVFEANSKPQDQVTLEVDDSGKLTVRFSSGSQVVFGGRLFPSGNISGSIAGASALTAVAVSSSFNNFTQLGILKSPDFATDRLTQFQVSPKFLGFDITPTAPIAHEELGGMPTANINHVESLPFDKRMGHVANYKFLPPINTTNKQSIGLYRDLGNRQIQTYSEIMTELTGSIRAGYAKKINFTETSVNNQLLCQFFEAGDEFLTKLDVVDYGTFVLTDNNSTKHVFFAGKLYQDDLGSLTFVNMFTLLFE